MQDYLFIIEQKKDELICLYLNSINKEKNKKFPSKSVYKFVLGEETYRVVRLAINRQTGEKVSKKY